jgi:hypothetical protein
MNNFYWDNFCVGKNKNMNVEGGWKLKFMFGLMEITQELLHLC